MKLHRLLIGLICVLCLSSNGAWAACPGGGGNGVYIPLACSNGAACPNTQLFNEGDACKYVGIEYMFSTVMCQFVSMVNVIMGKFYCSIQFAVAPIVVILITLFVIISGIQFTAGIAQFNTKELITRLFKLSMVYWLVTDPTRGISAGIGYVFDFFIAFIADTTRWVIQILDATAGNHITGGNPADVGTVNTFRFIDELIYTSLAGTGRPALTGLTPEQNAKVIGFFVALVGSNFSLLGWVISFFASIFLVFLRTLFSFLIAVISIAFLMGLSPIFISFMLFQVTFQYFDIWMRFMVSYCLQVMITFAILALYLYSLTLFSPFFGNLAEIVFPYKGVPNLAPSIWKAADTWGVCPLGDLQFTATNVEIHCKDPYFSGGPGVQSPSKVAKMDSLIFFLFYNMISLVLISFGFNALQKNTGHLARQLAGPAYVPIVNGKGIANNSFRDLGKTGEDAQHFTGRGRFKAFNNRHQAIDEGIAARGAGSYLAQIKTLLTRRGP